MTEIIAQATVNPGSVTVSCQVPEEEDLYISAAYIYLPTEDINEVINHVAQHLGNILLSTYNLVGITLNVELEEEEDEE